MNGYLKSFIIGSSWPVVMLFFLLVSKLKNKNYSYEAYTMIAPVYLGLMNMLSLCIARKYKLSLRMRYVVIGILSPLIIIAIATSQGAYNFTDKEWARYAMRVIIEHFFVFNVIVYSLEVWLSPRQSEANEVNKMVSLIIKRGILAPNCKWWEVSSRELEDASGVELYYKMKKKYGKLVPVKMAGKSMYLVTDINYIRIILENSPFVFGVGILKYKMFKSFMKYNLGVSEGCPWIKRRTLNIQTLDTDRLHEYAGKFNEYIKNILKDHTPTNFEQFSILAKKITMQVVFGTDVVVEEVFQIFSEANSMKALVEPDYEINPKIMSVYLDYLAKNIANPNPDCLVYLAVQASSDQQELIHQIPHWIFPIVGLIHTSIPRLLLLLVNHPDKLYKLLGGGMNTFARKEVKGNGGGVYYRWYAYSAKAGGIMMMVYPLLSKRRQFQIRKVFATWMNDGKMSETDRATFFKCGHRRDSEFTFNDSRGHLQCRICTRATKNRSQRKIRALKKAQLV